MWRGGGGGGDRERRVVGSEAALVPSGWGWEMSAIPNDIILRRKYETRRFDNIFLRTNWVKKSVKWWFHTLRVPTDPTDPLEVITDSKSPENVFYTIWALLSSSVIIPKTLWTPVILSLHNPPTICNSSHPDPGNRNSDFQLTSTTGRRVARIPVYYWLSNVCKEHNVSIRAKVFFPDVPVYLQYGVKYS